MSSTCYFACSPWYLLKYEPYPSERNKYFVLAATNYGVEVICCKNLLKCFDTEQKMTFFLWTMKKYVSMMYNTMTLRSFIRLDIFRLRHFNGTFQSTLFYCRDIFCKFRARANWLHSVGIYISVSIVALPPSPNEASFEFTTKFISWKWHSTYGYCYEISKNFKGTTV